jgi:hypothetical protein
MKLGHIDSQTMSLAIWVFAIFSVIASYTIGYNHDLYHIIMHKARLLPCARLRNFVVSRTSALTEADDDEDAEERDVVILGFDKIAAALVAEFEHKSPQMIRKIHVLDGKPMLKKPLEDKTIKFTYGDIATTDFLKQVKGKVDLVLITIPDFRISGVSNERLLATAREVWPHCHIIVIADDPQQMQRLYAKGANYVLATKKLSAERIADMLTEHYSEALGGAGSELKNHLEFHRRKERKERPGPSRIIDLNLGPERI